MPKKMRTLFNHKNPSQHRQLSVSSSSFSQSTCREQPKTTLSFRASTSDQPSLTLAQYIGDEDMEDIESIVIRGVRTIKSSERLFFSPEKTNSILKKTATSEHHRRKLLISTSSIPQPETRNTGSISEPMISTMTMESLNPYMDFRSSMEEMVEAHRLHDWDLLEELLGCYLMLNDKRNHCHVIRAFADLVLLIKSSHFVLHQLTTTTMSSDSFVTSFSSPLHLSSTSNTAETSCSSSSIALAEAASSQ